jgi:hypothetical protein
MPRRASGATGLTGRVEMTAVAGVGVMPTTGAGAAARFRAASAAGLRSASTTGGGRAGSAAGIRPAGPDAGVRPAGLAARVGRAAVIGPASTAGAARSQCTRWGTAGRPVPGPSTGATVSCRATATGRGRARPRAAAAPCRAAPTVSRIRGAGVRRGPGRCSACGPGSPRVRRGSTCDADRPRRTLIATQGRPALRGDHGAGYHEQHRSARQDTAGCAEAGDVSASHSHNPSPIVS